MSQRAFSVLGDSISTFEGWVSPGNRVYYEGECRTTTGVEQVGDTWWMRVVDKLGGRLLANGSFSGSMVEGAGFPAAWTDERIAQLKGPCGEHPDVVLVFIGINDYGWGGACAQAAGRSAAMPHCVDVTKVPQREAGAAPADALQGFSAAYDCMLAGVRRAFPQAQVWCLTLLPGRERGFDRSAFCYSLRGVELDAYNEAVRAAAKRNGCLVADVRALGYDYEASDGTHPTKRGMAQIAAMTLAAMASAQPSAAALPVQPALPADLFPASLRSQRLCRKPSCIGCPHARSTGNQWSCVCERDLRDLRDLRDAAR